MLTRSRMFLTTTRRVCTTGIALFALGAVPAAASVGGFEGADGNQVCNDALLTDWTCFSAASGSAILSVADASGASDDSIGGKDDAPGDWLITTGAVHDKSDITNVWRSSTESAPGHSFLNLAIKRVGGAPSNANFVFELNQRRTTFVNKVGTTVPCRKDGDVLVSYDLGATAVVGLSKWVGTPSAGDPADGSCPGGATGTWTAGSTSGATYEAGVNAGTIENTLAGATGPFAPGTFGEASLDISRIAKDLNFDKPCELFTSLQARSRSSSSTSSDLGDIVAATAISIAGCSNGGGGGGGGSVPAKPSINSAGSACLTGSTVTVGGVAEPGAQVLVGESGETKGITDADPTTGVWSTSFAAVDGPHEYTATAVNGTGSSPASDALAIIVDTTPDAVTAIVAPIAGATLPAGPLTVSGTAEPGSTVTLTNNGAAAGTTVAAANGSWSIVIAAATTGAHALSVTAGDGCNASTAAATRSVTVSAPTGGGTPGGGTGNTPGGGSGTTPGGGTGTTPGGTGGPAGAVSPLAGLQVLGVTEGCAVRNFSAFVADKKKLLSRVVFKLDGKKIATVTRRDRQGRFVLLINPRRYSVGGHKLTLTLIAKKKTTKSRTISRPFKRCSVCQSRRSFLIHPKKVAGQKLKKATVFVNGKKVKTYTGKRLRARVTLTGLPKGTYKVKIVAVTVSGTTATETRTYRACLKRLPKKPATNKA